MMAASPSSAATGPPSSVADITSTRRSSRSTARDWRVRARPRSACRLRSWNSSKTTIPTPSSAGSCCSIRVSTPSVTTSMRVRGPTRVSMRTRKPTVSPTRSPKRCAMRWAAARAASRRGSSITIFRPPSHGSSSSASGTTVVFPAPGAAWRTADVPVRSAPASAGSTASIGRPVGGMRVMAPISHPRRAGSTRGAGARASSWRVVRRVDTETSATGGRDDVPSEDRVSGAGPVHS